MSDSVRPHRRRPTRLPRPWDSPGKNTGVGCHFLLQCMKVKSESEVIQLCSTPSDPMDCSLPGSSAHGIFQARVLEWGRGSQAPRRAVCGTRGSLRTMHGGRSAPSCCAFSTGFRAEQRTSLETPSRARASSCQEVGTTWFVSSCGGILELRRGSCC